MRSQELKKFYISFVGSLPVQWGIELEAVSEEVAKAEAILSLPEFSADWTIGDGNEKVVDAEIVSVTDFGVQEVKDWDLGRRELESKYTAENDWGDHPKYVRYNWVDDVTAGNTQLGYWDWVYHSLQVEHDNDSNN